MRTLHYATGAVVFAAALVAWAAELLSQKAPEVVTLTGEWKDAARDRRVPVLAHTWGGSVTGLDRAAARFPDVAFLAGHDLVARVGYPELEGHPSHALAKKLLPRGCGSVCCSSLGRASWASGWCRARTTRC